MALNRIFKDFFTVSSDINLVDHTPVGFGGTSWVEEEKTGVAIQRVQDADDFAESDITEGSDRHIYTVRPNPSNKEYDLLVKLVGVGAFVGNPWFFVARFTDTSNYYSAGTYIAFETADKKIFKKVTGTVTELASGDNGMAANDTLRFEVRDAAKKLYHNGSEILSTSDDVLTSIGRGGFGTGDAWVSNDDIRTGWQADNLIVDEITTANISWPDGTIADSDTSPFDTPLHTVSGSDKALVVATVVSVTDAGKEVTAVVWDAAGANESLTEVKNHSPSHGKGRIQIWLKTGPSNGTDKLINITHGDKCGVIAWTLNGVDATTPLDDYIDDSDTATDPSVTVPNAESGDLVFDVLTHLDSGNDAAVGADQTSFGQFNAAGAFELVASYQDGADGGVMSWTLTQSKEFALTGFNVNAAPTGPGYPRALFKRPQTYLRM